MKLTFIFSLFLLASTLCFSQDINKYLDDGGRTEADNIVKIDFTEILYANIPIIWEHRFSTNYALQGGVGLLTNSFLKPLVHPIFAKSDINPNLKGGFSLFAKPVLYFDGFESFYLGLPLYYRKHNSQVSSFEFRVEVGKQWIIGRHFAIELGIGIGMNNEYSLDGLSYIYNTDILSKEYGKEFKHRMVLPLNIKLGYVL